jgi:hypothetical protein
VPVRDSLVRQLCRGRPGNGVNATGVRVETARDGGSVVTPESYIHLALPGHIWSVVTLYGYPSTDGFAAR